MEGNGRELKGRKEEVREAGGVRVAGGDGGWRRWELEGSWG